MRALKRNLSLFLVISILIGLFGSLSVYAAEPAKTTTAVVIAASDFQNFEDSNNGSYSGSYTNNSAFIQNMFQTMGYETVDGFLFGGDYNFPETINNTSQTATGVAALRATVQSVHPELTDDRIITVQGNHDAANTPGIVATGGYDFEAYGVFAINEDDYMERGTDQSRTRQTAAKLRAYLAEKVSENFAHPIFVVTHVPLHFNTRTQRNGDGKYAHDIFDVLNEYGERLNIFFLFGHNHALGYDSYLGGSSIFLTRGDTLKVAVYGSQSQYTEETLNFTYMNCGYTGYFWFNYSYTDPKTSNPPADSTLTMTSFEITGDSVTVHRWDLNGLHDLKSAGQKISKAVSGIDYTDTWDANSIMYGGTVIVDAPIPPSDLTELNSAIRQAEECREEDYTPETWSVLAQALASARLLTQENPQNAVDSAARRLRHAIAGLQTPAEAVDALIGAIGTVTPASGTAIAAARAAYDALSEAQKAEVTRYARLEQAELVYARQCFDAAADCGGDQAQCVTAAFTDMPAYTNWAHKGIEFCVAKGLLAGTQTTRFSPKDTMTRAMLVTVLWRYEGEPKMGTNPFTDVAENKWYTDAITWASATGVVQGVSSTRFDPNGAVTREQVATILARYYARKAPSAQITGSLAGYPDADTVGSYAKSAMGWALREGILTGTEQDGEIYLQPKDSATRAQVAAMLMRFVQNVAEPRTMAA